MTAELSNRLPELAARINAEHAAAASAIKRGIEHAITAGELLIEAKTAVPHGQWATWLTDNTPLSERSAQRYMQLARERPALEAKSATVADLTIKGACEHIAESAKTSVDDWEIIAGDMLDGPFRKSDFETQDRHWLGLKLCHQMGLGGVVGFCLGGTEDYGLPMLRLCCDDDLVDALKIIAPYAKGDKSFPIDASGTKDLIGSAVAIDFTCKRMVGKILNEIEERERLTIDEWHTRGRKVLDKFKNKVEERLAALNEAKTVFAASGDFDVAVAVMDGWRT